jgi:2-polyprenyl-6-methoxyphenol hydroxylase-like FAD-dependent oxidoreductase
MAKPTISIIGGGLGGLTLGRYLLQRGIPVVIYDRNTSGPRYNYGITLKPWAYRPLCEAIGGSNENTFRNLVTVDKAYGATGKIIDAAVEAGNKQHVSFRANRGDLENWLREESKESQAQPRLDVKWEHELHQVDFSSDGNPSMHFKNGQTIQSNIIIGADGVHSGLRKSLLPESEINILPFVVFNGKRKIDTVTWDKDIRDHMKGSNIRNFKHGEARLNFSISGYETSKVCVSWTYSRPSRGTDDPLHKPNRALSAAAVIPEELYEELDQLSRSSLPPAFGDLFTSAQVRKDRILHWLMRTTSVSQEDLRALAQKGIVLIGDAAHAHPIVGGNGANMAIQDALSLAEEIIALHDTGNHDLSGWIDKRYSAWSQSIELATDKIKSLHATEDSANL